MVKGVFSTQIANTNVIINTHIHSIHTLKIFTSVTIAHNALGWKVKNEAYRILMRKLLGKMPTLNEIYRLGR